MNTVKELFLTNLNQTVQPVDHSHALEADLPIHAKHKITLELCCKAPEPGLGGVVLTRRCEKPAMFSDHCSDWVLGTLLSKSRGLCRRRHSLTKPLKLVTFNFQ